MLKVLYRLKRRIGLIAKKIRKYIEKERFLYNVDEHINPRIEISGPQFIHLGNNCFIGPDSKLLCGYEYICKGCKQKLYPSLKIGNNFHATRKLEIQCRGSIIIGNEVLIASNVFIIDYNHSVDASTINYLDNPLDVKNITIEDGVWIGNNVIILSGVRIGTKSIIGAGSVVTKNIPPYCIAVGNPARIVKKWDAEINKWSPYKNLRNDKI